MNIESLVREHPVLSLLTVVGGTSAMTALALRGMGARPTKSMGTVGQFAWDHPLFTAAGIVAIAIGVDKLRHGGFHEISSIVTGATRRVPPGRLPGGYQRPTGGSHQLAPHGTTTTRPGSYGQQQHQRPGGSQRQQPQATRPPLEQQAPLGAHGTPYQQPSTQPSGPQEQQAPLGAHETPYSSTTPAWAKESGPYRFTWPPT